MKITWIGHSCFIIEEEGFKIVLDPYADDHVPGYQNIREEADLVLCSHGHGDHNAADLITPRKNPPSNPFTVEEINTFHDPEGGKLRGSNTIRILSCPSGKLAHFGDLGCALTDVQKKQLSDLDVLLIPVGGFYTIDGKEAAAIARELAPKLIIPMHYRNGNLGYEVIDTVETFAAEFSDVSRPGVSTIAYPGDAGHNVIILSAQNG